MLHRQKFFIISYIKRKMQRRSALKQITLAFGGIVALPAWAHGWSKNALALHSKLKLPSELETILSLVVDTIIPATDTPGAREIGVDKFILTMIEDCYEKAVQEKFVNGLQAIEEAAKISSGSSFITCTSLQRTQILTKMEIETHTAGKENSSAFPLIKDLTIQGYLNSEYVMKNLLKYELIPGRFNGCFPVKS
jgi:hypothetical protein